MSLIFTPHLTPMIRGIHATLYARLTQPDVDLQRLFEKRYAGEPFVDVMPPGSQPDTRSVRASNVCRIAVHRPQGGDTAVILAVEDNLVKGAAGQAVQNMNLMFGLPESYGPDGAAGASVMAPTLRNFGRRLRQTFGISAPRMAVRTHLSWRWRLPALLVMLGLIAGMWWWGFDFGQFLGGFNRSAIAAKQAQLEANASTLMDENVRLRAKLAALESDLNMTRGTQATLSRQALDLQNENTQMKEELAFLRELFSNTGKPGTLTIQRLRAEKDRDDIYRFSMLVVRGGNPSDEFSGQLTLLASVAANGHSSTLTLPDDQPDTRYGAQTQVQVLSAGRRHVPCPARRPAEKPDGSRCGARPVATEGDPELESDVGESHVRT